MPYAVYTTSEFDKQTSKLDLQDKEILQKMFLQLKENPFVGDAVRYNFFREKRIREKRVYFLIYENIALVLLVAFGGKKTQQETINKIIELLPRYKEFAMNLSKQKN